MVGAAADSVVTVLEAAEAVAGLADSEAAIRAAAARPETGRTWNKSSKI